MTTARGRVLVDTSAWIEFFRDRDQRVAEAVGELLERGAAVLVGPVLAELSQGARTRGEKQAVDGLRDVLDYVEVQRADWERAGKASRRLRRKGATIPMVDILIATLARRHDLAVLTTDQHFEKLAVKQFGR